MSFFSWCQIVRFIMLVPNCPGAKLSGAKLSVFIMLVPNCPGAKLSGAKLSWCQIVLVPNCPLLLSWCQIVRFYYLGAKLSALLSWCQIVRCQIVLQSTQDGLNWNVHFLWPCRVLPSCTWWSPSSWLWSPGPAGSLLGREPRRAQTSMETKCLKEAKITWKKCERFLKDVKMTTKLLRKGKDLALKAA